VNKSDFDDLLLLGNLNLLPATFLDDKDALIISKAATLMRFWHDEELNPSLLFAFLKLPREFKKIRCVAHLKRIICSEYFYKKKVIKAIDQYPHKRHLYVKLFHTKLEFPFGSKAVLGIMVTFNLMKQREAFEEGHILESIRNILPDIHVVKGSFIESQDKKNQVHVVYLEIEREEQEEFTLEEMKRLQGCLPSEFKGCIEELVPVTFMRRNEEEVYRNILALRDQLKTIKDIPQTTITFEEQTQFDLFFTVIVLRVIKESTPPLLEILEKEHPEVVFIPDRVDHVSALRKQYKKEATVFRLQLPKSQFFRKDRSVNLYKARQKVFSMLVKTLGPVRDYNGGLILKQNERLEDFLALTPKLYDEFFRENFFYSITPIAMQSILPAALVKEWFLAFSELLEKELSRKEVYLLFCRTVDEAHLVIVRAEDSSFKELLLKEISYLSIPSLELAFSEINMHGAFCFGFLYRPSLVGKEKDFCKVVKETMEKWSESMGPDQELRLALHGSEPSLDPRIAKGDKSYIVIKMLFDGLTRIGLDGKPRLAIAKSYMASSDYKTFTFSLRESKWSNGTPITAYDFEYSWKKSLDPQTASFFSHPLYLIKNARLAKENKIDMQAIGIKAADEKTLIVELEYPVPYFLDVAAHWTFSLINRAIDQKYPGWAYQAGETYVCNGPFKLVEWKHSRTITLEKNPYYWDADAVKLKKIAISMLEPASNGSQMLERGEVDLLGRPMTFFTTRGSPAVTEEVEKVTYPLQGILILCFNTAQFPFNHKKIRQAFSMALNRERLSKIIQQDSSEVCASILPISLAMSSELIYPDDALQKARVLFREGLGEIGFVKSDFPRLSLTFHDGPQRLPLYKMLRKQWQDAFGIDVQLKDLEWGNHFDRLLKGKFHMACTEWYARWSDALHLLECFEDKNDFLNFSRWEHPYFQKILRQAKQAAPIDERKRLLYQAEVFLAAQLPITPLYKLSGNYIKRKGLKNVFTSDTSEIDFKWAYKEIL
jgi:oligopeptide transport system substrate-binding protein